VARHSFRTRPGFTLVEATVALAIVAVLAAIVAQAMVWSLRERTRSMSHHAALELAANVLEDARAQPWDRLDKAWADRPTVPSEMAALLPEGKIIVTVEPAPALPSTRRVTVEVRWESGSVRLTTLLTGREAKKAGGKS
jgi:prepilin-type N-terminal cleavage/methylation domain-containing protein